MTWKKLKNKNCWVNRQENSMNSLVIIKEKRTNGLFVIISKHKKDTDTVNNKFKEFDKPSEAVNYAKSYMRKHPKG